MYFVMTNRPPEPNPAPEAESAAAPQQQPTRQRRKSGPPYPPARIYAAMGYVAQCNAAMQPFCKETSSRGGTFEAQDYENELVERDLHPAQIGSFRAACDVLQSYFNGEGWQQPRGLRTREAYEEFLGILAERRKAKEEA